MAYNLSELSINPETLAQCLISFLKIMLINRKKYIYKDFTEKAYRDCIHAAQSKDFKFIGFRDYKIKGKNCLWRHDIDFSPHRALAMARIEQEEGVIANYFVWMHSDFYNLLEQEITHIIKEIGKLEHPIGLHFDVGFYENSITSFEQLELKINYEKSILENILGAKIHAFSFHNPIMASNIPSDKEVIGGLINAYSATIKDRYTYCSDSFCYWRYRRLMDVIHDPLTNNLHALTHPECWSRTPMSPYQRILNTFEGRKKKSIEKYLSRSKNVGRKIIK